MELKVSYYIKAKRRIRDMLRQFPSIKRTLTFSEKQKLTADLARHLQKQSEEAARQREADSHIHTKSEYCRHCIYSTYTVGKQVMCEATNRFISERHRGKCDKYKEGYKNY